MLYQNSRALPSLPFRQSPTHGCCFNFLFLFCLVFIWWQKKDASQYDGQSLKPEIVEDDEKYWQTFMLPLVSFFSLSLTMEVSSLSLQGSCTFGPALSWRKPSPTYRWMDKRIALPSDPTFLHSTTFPSFCFLLYHFLSFIEKIWVMDSSVAERRSPPSQETPVAVRVQKSLRCVAFFLNSPPQQEIHVTDVFTSFQSFGNDRMENRTWLPLFSPILPSWDPVLS